MGQIKFGTSGWRGIIADDFTFTNVRTVTRAISEHFANQGLEKRGVVVGYDTRFLSEAFAHQAVKILSAQGIHTFLCVSEIPTPAISHEIIRRGAGGAINITASHSPAEYNGLKLSGANGASALPEVTRTIEIAIQRLQGTGILEYPELSLAEAETKGLLTKIDPRKAYLERLEQIVDLGAIASSGLKIVVDNLYGAARHYLSDALRDAGCCTEVLHDWRDPYFGNASPDPSEENLKDLSFHVMESGSHLGLATDGDGDRFGIVDADGTFIHPNHILALLLKYLIRSRGWHGAVGRTIATSHLIDAVARRNGIPVIETPVGFKYIGELISQDLLILGGEESGGLSVKGHVPEKDGLLACLLVAEMVARADRARLRHLLQDLFVEVGGPIFTRSVSFRLESKIWERLPEKLERPPTTLGGQKVAEVKSLDGTKLIFDDESWILFRPSGTGPTLRLYAECRDGAQLGNLLAAGEDFVYS